MPIAIMLVDKDWYSDAIDGTPDYRFNSFRFGIILDLGSLLIGIKIRPAEEISRGMRGWWFDLSLPFITYRIEFEREE